MYIEQILTLAIQNLSLKTTPLDMKILNSLWSQSISGTSFTDKQGTLCVNLLKKYRNQISQFAGQDISIFLENPQFKQPFRTINSKKSIKIVDHTTYIKALRVDFPYDEEIVQKFRNSKQVLDYAIWDKEEKCWFLSLDEKSIKFVISLITDNNFLYEENLKYYIDQVKNIESNVESLIPMAVIEDNRVKFINVSQFTPQNNFDDFLESMMFAKEVGISTWNQEIDEKIDSLPHSAVVKKLVKHDMGKPFDMNVEETPIEDLLPIIKYLLPCLVIIPDKNELEKLQKTWNFFQKIGINASEVSVLFRLPSETDNDFNEFVRNNKLNSPLSENTKVVFVSNQIPKTILGPRVEFNSILNYNYYAAHYKIREYLFNHKNVINILDRMPQRSFSFALMQSNN